MRLRLPRVPRAWRPASGQARVNPAILPVGPELAGPPVSAMHYFMNASNHADGTPPPIVSYHWASSHDQASAEAFCASHTALEPQASRAKGHSAHLAARMCLGAVSAQSPTGTARSRVRSSRLARSATRPRSSASTSSFRSSPTGAPTATFAGAADPWTAPPAFFLLLTSAPRWAPSRLLHFRTRHSPLSTVSSHERVAPWRRPAQVRLPWRPRTGVQRGGARQRLL